MIFVAVSTGHFDPLIRVCNELKDKYDFLGQVGMSRVRAEFEHFITAPPEKIESCMAQAELVVTHAGTGMLSSLFRLKKRHVLIPKQIRYGELNDGQVELARKWGELGIGTLCMDVEQLAQAIETCRRSSPQWVRLPSMGQSVRQALGWEVAPACERVAP